MGHAIGGNAGFKGALAPEDHHGAGQAAIDLVAASVWWNNVNAQ